MKHYAIAQETEETHGHGVVETVWSIRPIDGYGAGGLPPVFRIEADAVAFRAACPDEYTRSKLRIVPVDVL